MAVYLITGANRGIGRGLTAALLTRRHTTVIALVRDPQDATSQSLSSLVQGQDNKVIVVPYDASVASSAAAAVETIEKTHDIHALDVVIANAGAAAAMGPGATAKPEHFVSDFTINTLGPFLLFQATAPLLRNSPHTGKFFTVSSALGSTTIVDKTQWLPAMSYGISKAAVNHTMRRLHFENPDLIVTVFHPGLVQTAMGNQAAAYAGLPGGAPVTIEDSVKGILDLVDKADRETASGRFFDVNSGSELPW